MARYFDGVDDYISFPFSWTIGDPVTVTFWVYLSSSDVKASTLFKATPLEVYNRFLCHCAWSDRVLYFDYGDPRGQGRISYNFSSYMNKWTYVALISNAQDYMAIYLDGVLVTSTNAAMYPTVTFTGLEIGREWGYWKGHLAEFRIYNRVLSEGEIRELMYRRSPVTPNLKFYAPLWERTGSSVLDHAGNRIGTIYGATYANDPPMLGGSMVGL